MTMIVVASWLHFRSSSVLRILKMAIFTLIVASTMPLHMVIFSTTRLILMDSHSKMALKFSVFTKMPISAIKCKLQIKLLRQCSLFNQELHPVELALPQMKSCLLSKSHSSTKFQSLLLLKMERKSNLNRPMDCIPH